MATFTGVMIVGPSLAMNGFLYNPLFFGFVTGLVIGDVRSGFSIGATCMLMSLGFYTYGGATIPDYNVGAIYRHHPGRPRHRPGFCSGRGHCFGPADVPV